MGRAVVETDGTYQRVSARVEIGDARVVERIGKVVGVDQSNDDVVRVGVLAVIRMLARRSSHAS